MAVLLKRVYEKASSTDGARVLVDRLWPRGITKESAALEAWMKDLAPSNELRRWFHAHPQQWEKFRKDYLKELANEAALDGLQKLHELEAHHGRLTLVFAARDERRNNAVVLKQLVEGQRKPPTGTGPMRTSAQGRSRAARKR